MTVSLWLPHLMPGTVRLRAENPQAVARSFQPLNLTLVSASLHKINCVNVYPPYPVPRIHHEQKCAFREALHEITTNFSSSLSQEQFLKCCILDRKF